MVGNFVYFERWQLPHDEPIVGQPVYGRLVSAHDERVTLTFWLDGQLGVPACGTAVGNQGGPKLLLKRVS